MLNWSKIDNPRTFQRLVSQLVALECNTPVFYPSSPYIGADGGYDAYLENYPDEKITGKICIQVKYSKHSLKDLYDTLRKALPEEIGKAQNNQIQHLILVTNGELSVPYIKELLKLNSDSGVQLYIWDREKINLKIEKQPFLRWFYFDNPSVPLFVPPDVYFSEVEKCLISENLVNQIESVKKVAEKFKAFAVDQENRIFVVHAPGGYGKSHLIREMPSLLNKVASDREVWYVRYGVRNFQEAFGDEIGSRETGGNKHKYVVVVDDADRIDDVADIILCTIKSGIDIKLVFSLRTAGIFLLEDTLMATKTRGMAVITSISTWTPEELQLLLKTVAQKDQIKHIEDIVAKYDNPYFLVRIGLNMRGAKDFNLSRFKQEIIQSLINDSKTALQSYQNIADKFLLNLSLITPINTSDKSTLTKLAKKFQISTEQCESILGRLKNVGILRSIGRILRFIPDMLGDVYLLEKMGSLVEEERKEVFTYWFDSHSKSMFCNLGATLLYGEDAYLMPVINDVISGWIRNVDKYDDYKKRHILGNLEEICRVVPERTVDLVWTFLNKAPLSTDDYGPVIVRLIYSKCPRKSILKLIEGLREKSKLGTYGNYRPDTLVRELASPLGKNIEVQIMPIFDFIDNLFNEDKVSKYFKMFTEILKEVLASAHEYTRSNYRGMEIGSRALMATEFVLKMRQRAISILKRILSHNDPEVRCSAVDVIGEIGKNRSFPCGTDIPLRETIINERNEMIDFIVSEELIQKESEWSVRSEYEDLLLNFWAHHDVPDEKIFQLLYLFKYGSEYRIFRYYASRLDITENVIEKLNKAPVKDRWKWFVDNVMQRKWKLSVSDFDKDADFLNKKYSDEQKAISFLVNLERQTTISSANALFLRAWFNKNPELFKSIRLIKEYWEKVPVIFKYSITYDFACKYPELVLDLLNRVLFEDELSIEEAKIALGTLECSLSPREKLDVIKNVANLKNSELCISIMQRIRFVGKSFTAEEMSSAIISLFESVNPDSYGVAIDNVMFVLHGMSDEYRKIFLERTRKTIEDTLLARKDLKYHDHEIIDFIFTDIGQLLDFIEKRLKRDEEIDDYSVYQSVPFDGFPSISKLIKSQEAFLSTLHKVLDWNRRYTRSVNFSLSKVFEQVVDLKQPNGELYLREVKESFFSNDKFNDLLGCLFKLPLNTNTLVFFNEVINKSKDLGFESEMAKLLRSKLYPEGGWSSSIGEVPPVFNMKKEVYAKLKETAPAGLLRDTLDQCVTGVKKMIKEHVEEERNRFYSR